MEKCLLELLEKEKYIVKEYNDILEDIAFLKKAMETMIDKNFILEKIEEKNHKLSLFKEELIQVRNDIKVYFV